MGTHWRLMGSLSTTQKGMILRDIRKYCGERKKIEGLPRVRVLVACTIRAELFLFPGV